ncbi:hypothetical protein MAFF301069_40080 (plasmid) [Ralstonia pseudosolanacearum]|nr:hypothetical protein MAFF301069_40080 [Ralstonia pseudosolanacearum]
MPPALRNQLTAGEPGMPAHAMGPASAAATCRPSEAGPANPFMGCVPDFDRVEPDALPANADGLCRRRIPADWPAGTHAFQSQPENRVRHFGVTFDYLKVRA